MRIALSIRVLCALALAVSMASAPTRAVVSDDAGAVLGVLQVQRILAAVMGGAGPDGLSDVNGDGCVDVLDFQGAVAQATGQAKEERSEEDDPAPARTCVLSPSLFWLDKPVCRPGETVPVSDEAQSRRAARDLAVAALPAPDTERYLFILTPHAPPCA